MDKERCIKVILFTHEDGSEKGFYCDKDGKSKRDPDNREKIVHWVKVHSDGTKEIAYTAILEGKSGSNGIIAYNEYIMEDGWILDAKRSDTTITFIYGEGYESNFYYVQDQSPRIRDIVVEWIRVLKNSEERIAFIKVLSGEEGSSGNITCYDYEIESGWKLNKQKSQETVEYVFGEDTEIKFYYDPDSGGKEIV